MREITKGSYKSQYTALLPTKLGHKNTAELNSAHISQQEHLVEENRKDMLALHCHTVETGELFEDLHM